MCGCLCGVMMSLFFSQTMSGSGFPMALTASSTRVPSFTLMFLSFSVNWGRTKVSLAKKDRNIMSTYVPKDCLAVNLKQQWWKLYSEVLPSTVRVTEMDERPALFWATTVHSPESWGMAGTMIRDWVPSSLTTILWVWSLTICCPEKAT